MWYDMFVKWERVEYDGRIMKVLYDKHKPVRWLSVGGEIYDFHLQLGRWCFTRETKDEYKFLNDWRAGKDDCAKRHPASGV